MNESNFLNSSNKLSHFSLFLLLSQGGKYYIKCGTIIKDQLSYFIFVSFFMFVGADLMFGLGAGSYKVWLRKNSLQNINRKKGGGDGGGGWGHFSVCTVSRFQ